MQVPSTASTMRRILLLIIITVITATCIDAGAATPKRRRSTRQQQTARSAEHIKKEQNNARRKISETSSRISNTGRELKRQLNSLNAINADIRRQEATVTGLRTRIDSLGTAISGTSDSIVILERDLENLRTAYANALRKLQPSADEMNTISFIFSARSFSEAYSRMRYLNRFSEWRGRKAADISRAIDRIAERRQHLTDLRHQQDRAYRHAEEARRTLAAKQDESQKLVTSLRRQDTQLRAELANQKKQARALDRELDRLIAAEQQRIAREETERKSKERKASSRKSTTAKESSKGHNSGGGTNSARAVASSRAITRSAASTSASSLSGSFADNKGRLLFPVSGRYKIVRPFGRQPHPTQRHVVTDNSGIDIEVPAGSTARAVFDGTVSAIFRQDGFHTIIMLRHGKYLTVYAGLTTASVRQGQKVKAGQSLGKIFADPADDNRTILHFEVRNERNKLNPSAWVK